MKIAEFFDKHFGAMLATFAVLMVVGLAFGA